MTPFTPAQESAIDFRRLDACVVAGPGSGKTTVLVERYSRLITRHNFEPRHILAITFTEKAAANMKAKLAAHFRHDAPRLRELESGAWVSTIHGFCMRLLRENAIAAGIDPRFTVLSQRESDQLQWECLHAALDEMTEQRRELTLELIEALQSPRLAGQLKDTYDAMRSAGLSVQDVRNMPSPSGPAPAPTNLAQELRGFLAQWPIQPTAKQIEEKSRLLEWCRDYESAPPTDFPSFLRMKATLKVNLGRVPTASRPPLSDWRDLTPATLAAVDNHAAPFRAMIFDVLARFDTEYRNRKIARSKVDFNDLERLAIALLKGNAEVQARVRKQFRQIMLDEFQDINGQQAELIYLLRSDSPEIDNSFFGVGDRNQSIYGFRHARPEIFLDYRDEVRAREGQFVDLIHNFRSRAAILHCVREVLTGQPGIEDRELVPGANFARKDEPSIEILKILGATRNPDDESDEDSDKGDREESRDAASEREAAWIAHRVRALRGTLQLGAPGETRPAEYRDFAVLCRGGDSMLPILAAFEHVGIPYVCGRRQSFLLSREGLDITALLSIIANPRDSISLATVLRSPFVGISDETLLRIKLTASSLTSGLNKFAAQYTQTTETTQIPNQTTQPIKASEQTAHTQTTHSIQPSDRTTQTTQSFTQTTQPISPLTQTAQTIPPPTQATQLVGQVGNLRPIVNRPAEVTPHIVTHPATEVTPTPQLDGPDATTLAAFTRNLARWRQDQSIVPLDALIARALSDCGYAWTPASHNIESFLHLARTTGTAMALPAFLEELESLADAAGTESDLSDEDQGDCVQVMTAHAAKGLEFPVTIIAAMDKGSRRESRPVTFTEQHGLGVKWRNPADAAPSKGFRDGLKDSWAEANKLVLREREAEEENRLLYVAMTRAEEHLILSYSCGKNRPSNWAGLVERRFDPGMNPSPDARREEREGYSLSILVADTDPPPMTHTRTGDAEADAEITTVPAPATQDLHETAVTVTSLAVFATCPRKYYIQRSLGWNTGRFRRFDPDEIPVDDNNDSEDDLTASDIGSEVHAILAGAPSPSPAPEAQQLADVFLNSELGARVAASPRVAREWAFIADIDGTIVRGSIDLWFEENGELHIVDYKTDAVAHPDDYIPQLALYAIALERAIGQRPRTACLHYLRLDRIVEIPLNDATIEAARALISGLRRAQNDLRFDLNEGDHCRTCTFYKGMCPAGHIHKHDDDRMVTL